MFRFYVNCHNWTPSQNEWLQATRYITQTELERIHKFVFQRDAKFALAGQLLIRYLLAQALQRKSSSFEIQRTEYGRPFIDSPEKFDFNLSHHYHLVCIAGTFHGLVGCDTMEYRVNTKPRESIESLTDLLRKEFTKNEYDYILKKSSDVNVHFRHFYRIWCLKESYVKWLGCGIGFTLARMNFCIQTDEFDESDAQQVLSDTKLELDNAPLKDDLRFDEQIIPLENNEKQIIAVCLSNKNSCQPFIELTITDILQGCSPLDETKQADEKWWQNFQAKKIK